MNMFLKSGRNMLCERETAQICRVKEYVLGGGCIGIEGVECQGEMIEFDPVDSENVLW